MNVAVHHRLASDRTATFMLAIGLSLLFEVSLLAYTLEGLLLAALGALIFGRFCLGSYLFLLFTGQSGFAIERFRGAVRVAVSAVRFAKKAGLAASGQVSLRAWTRESSRITRRIRRLV